MRNGDMKKRRVPIQVLDMAEKFASMSRKLLEQNCNLQYIERWIVERGYADKIAFKFEGTEFSRILQELEVQMQNEKIKKDVLKEDIKDIRKEEGKENVKFPIVTMISETKTKPKKESFFRNLIKKPVVKLMFGFMATIILLPSMLGAVLDKMIKPDLTNVSKDSDAIVLKLEEEDKINFDEKINEVLESKQGIKKVEQDRKEKEKQSRIPIKVVAQKTNINPQPRVVGVVVNQPVQNIEHEKMIKKTTKSIRHSYLDELKKNEELLSRIETQKELDEASRYLDNKENELKKQGKIVHRFKYSLAVENGNKESETSDLTKDL